MRRTALLIVLAAALLALVTGAAVAAKPPPRGTLTSVEYHELLAVEKAEKKKPKTTNVARIARLDCKSLTRASRLTSTQHAECVAALYFFSHLYEFTGRLTRCEKSTVQSTALRCVQRTTDTMYRTTHNFSTTNAASTRAAKARAIAGKCLDYLVFTPRQANVMRALAPALRGFGHAIRVGNSVAVARFGKRLTTDLVAALKVFDVTGSVRLCRHD